MIRRVLKALGLMVLGAALAIGSLVGWISYLANKTQEELRTNYIYHTVPIKSDQDYGEMRDSYIKEGWEFVSKDPGKGGYYLLFRRKGVLPNY